MKTENLDTLANVSNEVTTTRAAPLHLAPRFDHSNT